MDLLTTYGWVHRGTKGSPAKAVRSSTTNCFDPQNWRNRSDYQEKYFTPPIYSRHQTYQASPYRNNRPHARIDWPMEPNKSYMIWKPKLENAEIVNAYSAPSLLRHFKQNNWKTTTQTSYQDYFRGNLRPKKLDDKTQWKRSRLDTRKDLESALNSKESMRPATENLQTPPHLRSIYRGTFVGDLGRPSTNAKPPDYSWRHIKY